MKTEWGMRQANGSVFPCRDRSHAEAMMRSTSIVLGPMVGRKIVSRQVSEWEEA